MAAMDFFKMQGTGNDFIIVNNIEANVALDRLPVLSRRLCQRRISLGADALMVFDAADQGADFKMRFYNADGSLGEMCGNGARCLARYAYERGLAGEHMKFETGAGLVEARRLSDRQYQVKLNSPEVIETAVCIEVNGLTVECDYIELGRPGLPHVVVYLEELDTVDEDALRETARAIRFHRRFPKGANVNFYKILGPDHVLAKTFERGVEDFTLACGTGSASVALSLTLRGRAAGDRVRLTVPGGDLSVEIEHRDGGLIDLYLLGDTNIVAKGEITDEDLEL